MLLLLVPLSLSAAETGYKIVHPDGTVEFTDDPHRGGEPIELKEAPTFKSPPVPINASPSQPQDREKKSGEAVTYRSITITSPKRAQTIWFDGSGIAVNVQTDPSLQGSDEVVIEIDGKPVARGHHNAFTLEGVYRGEHKLVAKILDGQGNTRVQSDPVIFYMKRHTINKP